LSVSYSPHLVSDTRIAVTPYVF